MEWLVVVVECVVLVVFIVVVGGGGGGAQNADSVPQIGFLSAADSIDVSGSTPQGGPWRVRSIVSMPSVYTTA